jgi:hypothetical protein
MLSNIYFPDYRNIGFAVGAGAISLGLVGCAAKGCNALFHHTVHEIAKELLKNKLKISKEWRKPLLDNISYILPVGLLAVTAVTAAYNTVSFPATLAFVGVGAVPLAAKGILTFIEEHQKASEEAAAIAAAATKKADEKQPEIARKAYLDPKKIPIEEKAADLQIYYALYRKRIDDYAIYLPLDKPVLDVKAVWEAIPNDELNKEKRAKAFKALEQARASRSIECIKAREAFIISLNAYEDAKKKFEMKYLSIDHLRIEVKVYNLNKPVNTQT